MHFKTGEESIVLQGNPSLDKTQVSLKSLVKTCKDGEQGILLELGSLGVEPDASMNEVHSSIKKLLQNHREVFEWPNVLPPPRARDHESCYSLGQLL